MKKILFLLFLVLLNCKSSKNRIKSLEEVRTLESIKPYKKCTDNIKIKNVVYKGEPKLLKDLNSLSYSTAYTSVYTPHKMVSDTVQKDSIRYLYASRVKELVKIAFPEIEITNDSNFLRNSNPFINRNLYDARFNTQDIQSVKNLIIPTLNSKKQLFIDISSSFRLKDLSVNIGFYIYDLENFIILYTDYYRYNCDIRDYETLEKVISAGLLKLIKKI